MVTNSKPTLVVPPRGAPMDQAFAFHEYSAEVFWRRFGGRPDVSGQRVLDFGSSTGGMLQNLLAAGAREVVGIDISTKAIDYSRSRLKPEWGDRVDIRLGDIRSEDIAPVDVIVSQNTLEHVMPLQDSLKALVDKCKKGGDIYLGFSPLWYSPFGNHQYPPGKLPWRHLWQGDDLVLNAMRRIAGLDYSTIHDAGFNKATPKDFFRTFRSLPVEVVSLKTNVTEGRLKQAAMGVASLLSKLPLMERFLTIGIYAHFRRV